MLRLAILTCLLTGSFAAGAELTATLQPQSAQIGDPLALTLTVSGAEGRTVRFPLPADADMVLLRADSVMTGARKTMTYTLAVYDTGHFTLPPLAVVVEGGGTDTLRTSPLTVVIRSILPDTAQAILPLKPLRAHPFQWRDLLAYWWVAALALLAAAGYLLWRRLRRGPQATETYAAEPQLPPDAEAIRGLIALRDNKYPARGMLLEFFTEFSQIMRRYVERRYEFAALEMTTFELSREFADPRLPRVFAETLLPVLQEADLVKFARYVPDYRRCETLLEQGFSLVEATRPRPEPAEQERAA